MKRVELHKVSYTYPSSARSIISDITFSVEDEIVAVLAPTGAGKTTLLSIISGLIKPSQGSVRIGGLEPKEAVRLKKIGLTFQDSTLIEWESVFDNILLPTIIGKQIDTTSHYQKKATELLSMVGLRSFSSYKCSALSGGMKQRVGLARALVTDPDVLLLDEPFNKLDYLTKSQLLVEFHQILESKKVSSLVVTHSIEDAVFIADRILVLSSSPCTLMYDIPITFESKRVTDLLYEAVFLQKVADIRELLISV